MPVVQLPKGCQGFDAEDGTKYRARAGTSVTVSDEHARALDRMPGNGTAGLITATFRTFVGTKRGMRCPADGRLWNAWTKRCNSCGTATIPE